jgi:hypothetical protein
MPLDGFNRALAVTIGTVVAVGGTAAALVAADLVAPGTVAPDGWPRERMTDLADLSGTGAVVATLAAGAVAAAGAALLVAELTPIVRRPYISTGDGSYREFAVRESAVERMVTYAGKQVEGVEAVEGAHVTRDDVGLRISSKVVLEPFAAAGPLAPLLEARICNAVYTMTGLPVTRVQLRIRHAEGETLLSR